MISFSLMLSGWKICGSNSDSISAVVTVSVVWAWESVDGHMVYGYMYLTELRKVGFGVRQGVDNSLWSERPFLVNKKGTVC
jgi:hypothetical protein